MAGLVRECQPDLVVLDPKTYRDTATYDKPHQLATGVRFVFVNGKLVCDGTVSAQLVNLNRGGKNSESPAEPTE